MKSKLTARSKILVAMSGGVDSSVAALLLKDAGYEVVGVSMHLYSCNKVAARSCCSTQDRLDAARVCEHLKIPFISIDLRGRFKAEVIEPFVDEYLTGRTPSPCILCNKCLKFGALFEEAGRLGAEAVATGHYARTLLRGGGEIDAVCRLLRGVDKKKDQSYFLFTLSQRELERVLFPVGAMTKTQVRRIAKENGLPTSEKRESQEICFVPDNDYAAFVEAFSPDKIRGVGDFVDMKGNRIGRHRGIHAYTVGQRRGIHFGIGARQYVVKIDADKNQVVLGSNDDLLKSEMVVQLAGSRPSSLASLRSLQVQIRSTHKPAKAIIEMISDKRVKVVFEVPQRAIAPGQAAVFYEGDEVLGGGWIG